MMDARLHRCYFFTPFLPGLLHDVIKCKYDHANRKWHESKVLPFELSPYSHGIEMKKFTDHPQRIRRDPKGDGEIVCKLRPHVPRSPCNDNGDRQGRYDHRHPQNLPYHAPADVFE